MPALRFLAGLLILAAMMLFIYDRTYPLQPGAARQAMSLGQHWSVLAPNSLAAARATVQTKVHPVLWDPVLSSLLALPAWLSVGTLGLAFGYLGRRRQRVRLFTN